LAPHRLSYARAYFDNDFEIIFTHAITPMQNNLEFGKKQGYIASWLGTGAQVARPRVRGTIRKRF
jgi:hypothetical protein